MGGEQKRLTSEHRSREIPGIARDPTSCGHEPQ